MKPALWIIIPLLAITGVVSAQQLGDPVVITSAPGPQQFPDVAYNPKDNTFLVVWENVVAENVAEIQGVVLSGDTGKPTGNPVTLMSDPASGIEAPEIAYNSVADEYLVVARKRQGEIAVAQRVSAQGQRIGDLIEIGTSTGPTFFDPAARARVVSVAFNALDKLYFVGLAQPSGQMLTADGNLDFAIPQFGIGTNPSVSWSSKSNVYLMAWEDRESRDTGAENLSAQLISHTGDLIGDIIRVRDQEFAEESPRIAYNPDDDRFLVIWDERIGFAPGNNTATDTIGQMIGADGKKIGQPIPIEAGTAYTLRQDVDYSPSQKVFLVVWKGDENPSFAFADIKGRFVGRDGSLLSDILTIYDGGDDDTDEGNSEQYYDESKLPVVAVNTKTGNFLVVWEESGTTRDPQKRDIWSRTVTYAVNVKDWSILN